MATASDSDAPVAGVRFCQALNQAKSGDTIVPRLRRFALQAANPSECNRRLLKSPSHSAGEQNGEFQSGLMVRQYCDRLAS